MSAPTIEEYDEAQLAFEMLAVRRTFMARRDPTWAPTWHSLAASSADDARSCGDAADRLRAGTP